MTAEGKDITPGRETKWTIHAEANPVKTIEVFETTDVHGYLVDTSSGNESTFQYRMAYIANVVNEARANAENDAVLLGEGRTCRLHPRLLHGYHDRQDRPV